MKKSNKILLGILLTAFLVLTSIHVALYAKFKRGRYTAYEEVEQPENLQTRSLQHIRYIRVKNIGLVALYATDSAGMSFDKGYADQLSFAANGDTLIVAAADAANQERTGNYGINLYVGNGLHLTFENTSVQLQEVQGSDRQLTLELDSARLITSEVNRKKDLQLAALTIAARNHSEINLHTVRVDQLNVSLQQSFLTEDKSTIAQLVLQADPESRISLSAPNFFNAHKKTAE